MYCGSCGAFNDAGAVRCKRCGADLMSFVAPGARPQAAPQAQGVVAPIPVIQRGQSAQQARPAAPVHQAASPAAQPAYAPPARQAPVAQQARPAAPAGTVAGPATVPRVPDKPRSSIMPRVTLVREDGSRVTITDFPATIGKGSAASVRIEGNGAVSRAHALIRFFGTFYAIEDKGSTNGTFLNGNVLAPGEAVKLHEGDTLTLGNEDFKVEIR